jgi:hypothetical protein
MLREAMIVVEIILLAIGSGIAAELILRTELPLHWLLCAGLVGVVLEPTIHPNFGPHLFHYSLLASTGAAALVIVLVRVANVILQTWHCQFRGS